MLSPSGYSESLITQGATPTTGVFLSVRRRFCFQHFCPTGALCDEVLPNFDLLAFTGTSHKQCGCVAHAVGHNWSGENLSFVLTNPFSAAVPFGDKPHKSKQFVP